MIVSRTDAHSDPKELLERTGTAQRLQYRGRDPADTIRSAVSTEASHRELAAIMFTDMVSYSALVQRDDELAGITGGTSPGKGALLKAKRLQRSCFTGD